MSKYEIVVLGRNYASLLGMIRAIGSAGYNVILVKSISLKQRESKCRELIKKITIGKSIEQESKYVKKCLYTVEPNKDELINLLLNEFKECSEKVILMPTDDYTASTIDEYQSVLGSKFICPNINAKPTEIIKIMDKGMQKKLAQSWGLNVANGYCIYVREGKYSLPQDIHYPIFVKPQTSFKGDKTIMGKCSNESELRTILDKVAKKYNCDVLAEEYIKITNEYAILGYCNKSQVYMPGIIRMEKSGKNAHQGVTLRGVVEPFSHDNAIYKQLERFLGSLNYCGLFDIDLYDCDGKMYFNELNLRFGASGYSITKSGVNLPKMYIDDIVNSINKRTDFSEITKSIFVNNKVNLEEFEANNISWKEYKENYDGVDFDFVKDCDDPKPYRNFKKRELLFRAKNYIRRYNQNEKG